MKLAHYLIITVSHGEFIAHSFNGGNTIDAELLANFSNMNVDGTVANNYIVTPYLVKDLVT